MINFYDYFVNDTIYLDLVDVIKMLTDDGYILIFNCDGIVFKTKQINF